MSKAERECAELERRRQWYIDHGKPVPRTIDARLLIARTEALKKCGRAA